MVRRLSVFTLMFSLLPLFLVAGVTHAQRAPAGAVRVMQRPILTRQPRTLARQVPVTGIRRGVHISGTNHVRNDTPPQTADASGFGGGLPLSIQDLLGISPQDGFNWQHVNAINGDLAIKALIDPVTQLQVAQAERLLRLTSGAFPASSGGVYYLPPESEEAPTEPPERSSTAPPQSQVIVVQQAPAQSPQHVHVNERVATEVEKPDQSGLVLVLRSGKQILVSAFARDKDQIVYITPDGNRLSVPEADLDSSATRRANRERGNFLQ